MRLKITFIKNQFLLIFFTFLSLNSFSQIAQWSLTSSGIANGVDSNIVASDFVSGSGLGALTFGSNGAFSNGWSTTGLDTNDYFEISLTPNAGYTVNLSAINFSERRSGTGIRDYQVRWSIDNFMTFTNIATVNVPDDANERVGNISGLNINVEENVTIKIRFYGYNAESGGGTWRINDATLNLEGIVSSNTSANITYDDSAITNFGLQDVLTYSNSQTFLVSGANLTNSIIATSPSVNFLLSLDDSTWSNSVSISPNLGSINNEVVYVKFYPQSSGTKMGDIVLTSDGAIEQYVSVVGTGVIPQLESPIAQDATSITTSSFVASWSPVSGSASYVIDVSTSPTFTVANGFTSDLIISEYVEGSASNKYIEIFNGTGVDVDLSNYQLQLYSNGSTSITTANTLSGTLSSGSTVVYKNSSATVYNGTATVLSSVNFNGDDAMALYKISTNSFVDIFGVIGEDPGTNWSFGGKATSEESLVRNSNIFGGITTNPTTFSTLGTDWTSSPQNDVSNLGYHAFDGGLVPSFVVGYDGLNVGNVTTFTIEGLSEGTTYYYRVRAVGSNTSENSNVITVQTLVPPSCIWDGSSWSNVVGPDEFTEATIDGAYGTDANGEIVAKKLTVTALGSLVINSGTNVYVLDDIVNNGTAASLVVENNANLLQINDVPVNVNVGNITVNRETSPLKRLDYVLWSSPVQYQYLQSFSPSTLATRFYTYNSATDNYVAVSSPSTTYFEKGNGYLIRTPDNHPTVPTIWASTFTGYPNNGTISIPVTANTYNAIGNPYPSTLDADAFIYDNGLEAGEALYFWRKENGSANPSYATYTLSGGVANTAGGSALIPTYAIQVGQGFIAKSLSTSLNFTNSMRVADNDNLFLRSNNKSRLWLDLTNNTGLFCQTLIAYMPNATSGIDSGIDGRILSEPTNGATLTSIIDNDPLFIIQGKGAFVDTDVVPLAFKTAVAGNFTISLSNVDGLFANNAQDIFLRDNLTNTITNLNNGDYTFATAVGNFVDRFEVVYQNTVLKVNDFALDNVVVYANNSVITINAGQTIIDNVKVYDVRGRLLTEKNNVNATEASLNIKTENQILLIQVTSNEGVIITKKVIN
jgi:trimeric autotransporter adhesin